MAPGRERTVMALVALLLILPTTVAGADDAAVDLSSPLTTTGIGLRVSRSSASLTAALEQDVGDTTFWRVALAGSADDDGRANLHQTSSGISEGVELRLGLGRKWAREPSERELARCDELWLRGCRSLVTRWLPAVDSQRICHTWVNEQPGFVLPPTIFLSDGDREGLTSALTEYGQRTCTSLAQDGSIGASADEPLTGSPVISLSINVGFKVAQTAYYPADGMGGFDLTRRESWKRPLSSVDVATTWWRNSLGLGVALRFEEAYEPRPVEVCHTLTQGDHSLRDCASGVLGEPSPAMSARGTLALAKNPVVPSWRIADLRLGAQATLDIDTTGLDKEDLFGDDSYGYRVSVPLFVAKSNAPWGVRAGLALEWSGALGDPEPLTDDDDLRVFAFLASGTP